MTRQSILIAASAVLLIVAVSLSAQYGGQPYQWSPQRYWEGRPDFSRGGCEGAGPRTEGGGELRVEAGVLPAVQ